MEWRKPWCRCTPTIAPILLPADLLIPGTWLFEPSFPRRGPGPRASPAGLAGRELAIRVPWRKEVNRQWISVNARPSRVFYRVMRFRMAGHQEVEFDRRSAGGQLRDASWPVDGWFRFAFLRTCTARRARTERRATRRLEREATDSRSRSAQTDDLRPNTRLRRPN